MHFSCLVAATIKQRKDLWLSWTGIKPPFYTSKRSSSNVYYSYLAAKNDRPKNRPIKRAFVTRFKIGGQKIFNILLLLVLVGVANVYQLFYFHLMYWSHTFVHISHGKQKKKIFRVTKWNKTIVLRRCCPLVILFTKLCGYAGYAINDNITPLTWTLASDRLVLAASRSRVLTHG